MKLKSVCSGLCVLASLGSDYGSTFRLSIDDLQAMLIFFEVDPMEND
jgi:hypothetical protein